MDKKRFFPVGVAVLLVAAVIGVVAWSGISGALPKPEAVEVTGVTLVASATNTIEFTPVPTGTQVPSSTPVPSSTATSTATRTPVLSATPLSGYTFYGSQLEFLRTNLGWNYETSVCGNGLNGVANAVVNKPDSCVIGIYQPKRTVTPGNYLFLANFYKFAKGSNVSTSYAYMLYPYNGPFIDPDVNWSVYNPTSVWEWVHETKFMQNVASEYELNFPDDLPPDPLKIIPVTAEEYSLILSRPDIFPGWIESHK